MPPPARIEDVTAAWLTNALQPLHPGIEVEYLESKPATLGTTTRICVRVTYNETGVQARLPTALFIKCHAENPNHDFLIDKEIYSGEVGFYRDIAHLLSIETAKCLAAELDQETGGFLLVLEDLVAAGATWGSALSPLSEKQAESIVRAMAAYHAAFWGEAGATAWMPRVGSGPLAENFRQRFSIEEELAALIATERGQVLTGGLREADTLKSAFLELQRKNAREPVCMLHGDPHVGNIAFLSDDRAILTDWQIVRRGRYAYDLAYCLAGGLAIEDRRAWLSDLISLYVTELDALGVQAPSCHEASVAVAESIIHGLVMFLANRETMLPEEINATYVKRYAAAAEELESLSLLASA